MCWPLTVCWLQGEGARVFYESLLEQKPDSWMAKLWAVEYGILSNEEAEEMYQEVLEYKAKQKGSSIVQ